MNLIAKFKDGSTVTVVAESVSIVPYTLNFGTKLTAGVSGQFRYGFNMHNWWWSGTRDAFLFAGAKSVRHGIHYSGESDYSKYFIYGSTTPIQSTFDAALADGMHITFVMLPRGDTTTAYTTPQDAGWGVLCANVVKANINNLDKIVFECGNEPNWNKVTGSQYVSPLKLMTDAMRAVSPNVKICGPCTNASYVQTAITFLNQIAAVPGAMNLFTHGSFHPYYGRPEWSFQNDLGAFPKRMDALAVKAGLNNFEYIASEIGYSNAIGQLADPTVENVGGLGQTEIQNMEVSADYYSRYIPLARCVPKLRKVDFYSITDENPGDPNFTNVQAHFGMCVKPWEWKPASYVCKDMFVHCQAAIGGTAFTRSTDWFVKLKTTTSCELIAWNPDADHPATIVVEAKAEGNLTYNIAGNTTKTAVPLKTGFNQVTVPISRRATVMGADVVVDFAEFVD